MRLTEKEYQDLCKKNHLTYIPPSNQNTHSNKKMAKHKKQGFDSLAEENYFRFYVKPKLNSGEFVSCDIHKKFVILNAIPEYHFGERVYTPDFFITKSDGTILVVEMKGKVIKKLQRDYPLRKHLFIEKFCIPNGWTFKEENSENWTQKVVIS